jgi:LPXTG-motif cell wall-anchored protein
MVNRLLQIFAGLLIGLGALWSVQGAGIVHLKPILCVADCTELQGASVQWLATGIGSIAVGGGLWYFARRRKRNCRTVSKE